MGIDVWIAVGGEHPLKRFDAVLEDATENAIDDKFEQELRAVLCGPRHLRECYGGGPYATKILCREAFEAVDRKARIPAALLRERLILVTSPSSRLENGDVIIRMVAEKLTADGGTCQFRSGSERTDPMTVEEAIRRRYEGRLDLAEQQIAQVRAFVEVAESEEAHKGEPCLILVSG
jgi:hypothetical protein